MGNQWKPINQTLRELHQAADFRLTSASPTLQLAPELDQLAFDPAHVQQIFSAALENLSLFPENEALVLQTGVLGAATQHRFSSGADGGFLTISLCTLTLPPGCIEHIPAIELTSVPSFKFFHELVSGLGGTILVCDGSGKLRRLRCILPIPLREPTNDKRSQETILLVEDEEFVRNVTCEVLELSGYRVLEAVDAESGIRIFQEHANTIDLLLTDVVMPGMNGHDLAKRLFEMSPGLKTIFMSGYTENAITREGLSDPRLVYLQKPFTLDVLTRKVREVLDDTSHPESINFIPPDTRNCLCDQA